MPGQPRDSYDTVVRKLADLERRMAIQERHKHPTGRNESSIPTSTTDAIVVFAGYSPGVTGLQVEFEDYAVTANSTFEWPHINTRRVAWSGAGLYACHFAIRYTTTGARGVDVALLSLAGSTGAVTSIDSFGNHCGTGENYISGSAMFEATDAGYAILEVSTGTNLVEPCMGLTKIEGF